MPPPTCSRASATSATTTSARSGRSARPGVDGSLDLVTVVDGARPATEVAAGIAALIDSARRTLDAAVYDFHPGQAGGAVIARALEAAAGRGVAVRVAFNLDHIGAPVAEHPDQARPQAGDGDAIEGLSVP